MSYQFPIENTEQLAKFVEYGKATAGAALTLTDTNKKWGLNIWNGHAIRIMSGLGAGQVRVVVSNTIDTITVNAAWAINPDATSFYTVIILPVAGGAAADINLVKVSGTGQTADDWTLLFRQLDKAADYGTASILAVGDTLTDSAKNWPVNMWANHAVRIISGTGAGQVRIISTNTPTVLNVASAWNVQPTIDSIYFIFLLPIAGGTTSNINVAKWGNVSQSGLDLTPLFQHLDIPLSYLPYERGTTTDASYAGATLEDTDKDWGADIWIGWYVRIVSGTGLGSVRKILSNTSDTLTVDGAWTIAMGDNYEIIPNPDITKDTYGINLDPTLPADYGEITTGAYGGLTMIDAGKKWGVNCWDGWYIRIVSGTGLGTVREIASNTANTITVTAAWTVAIGDKYVIINASAGGGGGGDMNLIEVSGTAQTAADWTLLLQGALAASGGALPALLKVIAGYNTGTVSVLPISVDAAGILDEQAVYAIGAGLLPGALLKAIAGYDGSALQPIKINAAGEIITAVPTTIVSLRLPAAAADTAESLTAGVSTPCKKVILTAFSDNAACVVFGDSSIIAAIATRIGTPLGKGETIEIAIADAKDIYIAAETLGEGVTANILT
jgi:hypothetical protein